MSSILYNPERKPKSELISEFVVRTDIYNEIMEDLETSSMQHPEQHYLLLGQRGSGKTTLLNRLKYGIEDSELLRQHIIPILFSEEQYNISELVNLWENIAQHLEDYHGFDDLYSEMESFISKKNFEEFSYDLLIKRLQEKNKKLVLLIDNIGDMLKKLDQKEIRRFRSILQTDKEMRLIVCSPFYLETLLDYHQPLFEFFKVIRLDGLNESETQLLLLKLAEINGEEKKITKIITETPERIETLRTLTGGVPRTIVLMYNIFIEFNNEDSVKDLEKILDAVTPLFKHRMDDLPTQQQKIVDAVAKNWDGISVKELKEKLRIEGKIISAQLGQLQKNQIIEAVDTDTKNNIYNLRERFFNIWYLMRYGRKHDRRRVIWLVKFLESWCTMVELEQRIVDYTKKIKDGKLDEQMINFYGEVYTAMTNMSSEMKILLKEYTPEYLSSRINIDDNELFRLAVIERKNKNYTKEIELLQQLRTPNYTVSINLVSSILRLPLDDYDLFKDLCNQFVVKIKDQETPFKINYFDQTFFFAIFIYGVINDLVRENFESATMYLNHLMSLTEFEFELQDSVLNFLVETAFMQFLKFRQPHILLGIFEKLPVWKDKLSPVYYATLKVLENDVELKKMPPEINQSVDNILNQIVVFNQTLAENREKIKG